jgi:hypothetical protein
MIGSTWDEDRPGGWGDPPDWRKNAATVAEVEAFVREMSEFRHRGLTGEIEDKVATVRFKAIALLEKMGGK